MGVDSFEGNFVIAKAVFAVEEAFNGCAIEMQAEIVYPLVEVQLG